MQLAALAVRKRCFGNPLNEKGNEVLLKKSVIGALCTDATINARSYKQNGGSKETQFRLVQHEANDISLALSLFDVHVIITGRTVPSG